MANKKITMGGGKHFRNLATVLALFLSLGVSGNVLACAEGDYECGANCCATLNDGILTISGSGKMNDYKYNTPWKDVMSEITSVQFASNSSITNIGDQAFWGATNLTSVSIPNTVTNIGNTAFKGTNLSSVTLPSSLTNIGYEAFYGNENLTSLTIPSNVETVGKEAFRDCSITDLTLNGGKELGTGAFWGNRISALSLPEGLEVIGADAFYDSRISGQLVIPDSVTEIKPEAFRKNNFSSVVIPDSVETVSKNIFKANSNLSEIIISDSIDTSGWNASALSNVLSTFNVRCIGDVEKCRASLGRFASRSTFVELDPEDENYSGYCTGQYTWQNGKCRQISETACNKTDKYYFNGTDCRTRTAKNITCSSSYKVNDGYCDRIRYTPAEAAKVVRDDNTNEIVITFKK